MAKVIVKHNRLHFNGINYFRAASENVVLGSYGEKRTPLFGANFLEVEGQIDPGRLAAIEVTIADIDTLRTREGDVQESMSGTSKGVDVDVSARQLWKKLRDSELKLVKFNIPFNDLEDAANADRDAFEELRDIGPQARIVSAIWVVMSAKLAEEFDRAQSFDVSGKRGTLKVDVKGGLAQSGATEVTLSEGTTFAYLLASIDWNKKKKKKRTKIVDLDTDQFGFN